MYEDLNINEIYISEASNFVIVNDRYFYVPYLKLLEEYCIKHKILIGGEIAINMMLDKEINKDDFSYDIYSPDPFDSARELADIFYKYFIENQSANKAQSANDKETIPKTIFVESNIKHKLFTIWFNVRPFIKIHKLDKHRDVKLIELISPVSMNTRFIKDKKILVMSEEIQLISIYKQLYNPYPTTEYKNYTKLLDIESKLYNKMIKGIGKKIIGSADNELSIYSQKILDKIMKMIKDYNVIIIGDYAVDFALQKKSEKQNRLQLLYGNVDNKTTEITELTDLLNEDFIKKLNNNIQKITDEMLKKENKQGLKTKYVKYDLNIPVDPFLRKYTIYLQLGEKSIPIMDIFNSLSYELVPFIKHDNFKYAGLFVLMRFKLIDIYSSRLIIKLSSKQNEIRFIENKILEFISQLKLIKEKINNLLSSDPFLLFQLNNYAGVYYPQNILNKFLMGDTKFKFTKYYPYLKDKLSEK